MLEEEVKKVLCEVIDQILELETNNESHLKTPIVILYLLQIYELLSGSMTC